MNQVDFIGNVLSLSCGEALGTFQGEVSAIGGDRQTISLKNAYRNGVRYEVPEVTIRAIDIKDLKILKTCEQVLQEKVKSIAERKPPKVTIGTDGKITSKDGFTKTKTPQKNNKSTPQKMEKTHNHNNNTSNGRTPKGKNQHDEITKTKKSGNSCKKLSYQNGDMENGHVMNKENRENGYDANNGRKRHPSTGSQPSQSVEPFILPYEHSKSKPIKIEGGKGRARGINAKNSECFSAPTDCILGDFDFDSNLKLFDKTAVFDEIGGEGEIRIKKFGHDDVVIADPEGNYCAITEGAQIIFKTVNGVPVPSISTYQQQKLFLAMEKAGLTTERRAEAVGINAARMALQLLGGNKRFSGGDIREDNPSIVVLAGPHIQGAQGVCCARHLANRDIDVTVFSPSYVKMEDSITSELALYKATDGKHITSCQDLPTGPVDLVIVALDCPNDVIIRDRPWCKSAKEWATSKRANIYAIDPPADSSLDAQFTLAIGMPLSYTYDTGALYLCDIGIPKKVFLSVDLDFVAPFGHRHVIPLRNS